MVAQTVRPLKWVIVSDDSTDGTDEIVSGYAAVHSWIELIRMPERRERHFAGKVESFGAGYSRLSDLRYEYIASLDGDISFDVEYFSFLLQKFAEDPGLGLVGTPFIESGRTYDYRFTNIEHVSGACQVFRRQCFEEIGGYVPVKAGGIDLMAVIKARMKGWKTRTFTEKVCVHHREMGRAQNGPLKAIFRQGAKDYSFGNHPVWELFRTAYQMTRRPTAIGGLALLCGYASAFFKGAERPVSGDMVRFVRAEQMRRLGKLLTCSPVACKKPNASESSCSLSANPVMVSQADEHK